MGNAPGATPFADIEAALGREVLARFPQAERVEAYGMRGWRVRRPRPVEWTHGTLDPNFLLVGLAERRQGVTLHVWNPVDWRGLARHRPELEEAGFKVMVGCLQFTRKRPYPLEAVARLLDGVRQAMAADEGQVPPYRTPRPKEPPLVRRVPEGTRTPVKRPAPKAARKPAGKAATKPARKAATRPARKRPGKPARR